MNTVKDTNGNIWRVDRVTRSGDGVQILPGFVQVNISKPDSTPNARAITIPAHIWERWNKGEIKVRVN